MCHKVQDVSVTKRQPIVVVVGVVKYCGRRVRVRVRVSRSCATQKTHTPARREALLELSVVTISLSFPPNFSGLWVFSPLKSLIDMLFISFEISSHFLLVHAALVVL